jgi:hypothetical protein
MYTAFMRAQTAEKKPFEIIKDPTAVAIAETAVNAMGGQQAILGYQDSLATGTLTIYHGESPTSFPIILKSKGTHETRVEMQMPNGMNIRIMKEGRAAIQKPDGTVRKLALNNLVGERVGHIPLLSLLAEYQSSKVSLAFRGSAQVNGQTTKIIALSFVPHADSTQGSFFSSITQTLFYIDNTTGLVDKIQYENYEQGNSQQHHRTIEEYFTGYQNVGGIVVPFRQTSFDNGKPEDDLVLKSVTFNVGLADSDFTVPQGEQR